MKHLSFLARQGRQKRGFTLIETMVAITVLMVAFTGPLAVAGRALLLASYSKDQTTAIFLAQEAIEIVRVIRDNNSLASAPWTSGLDACSGTCSVDALVDLDPFVACSAQGCPTVRQNSTNGLYGMNSDWPTTAFTRSLSIRQLGPDEIELIATVSWNRLFDRQVTVREVLFNWQ